MTTFKYAMIMFALILVTAACATDDPLRSDTAAGATAATQDEAAHETGEAEDGDAHEDGDGHDEEDTGTMVNEDDNMVMEDEAHEDGDAHDEEDTGTMVMEDDAASEADIAAADRSIEITMNEFMFSPASIEVSAGETIEFIANNDGFIEHEFRLSNDHRVEEHIAAGHESHGDEGGVAEGGHHEEGDKMILVQSGESASLVITFTEDTTFFTNIVCLIPGHFEAGMEGELAYAA